MRKSLTAWIAISGDIGLPLTLIFPQNSYCKTKGTAKLDILTKVKQQKKNENKMEKQT